MVHNYLYISMSSDIRPFLILKGGHGIFYVYNDLGVCCTHKSKTSTDKYINVDYEELKYGPSLCCVQESNIGHQIYDPFCILIAINQSAANCMLCLQAVVSCMQCFSVYI